jgi:hypothetical protein
MISIYPEGLVEVAITAKKEQIFRSTAKEKERSGRNTMIIQLLI